MYHWNLVNDEALGLQRIHFVHSCNGLNDNNESLLNWESIWNQPKNKRSEALSDEHELWIDSRVLPWFIVAFLTIYVMYFVNSLVDFSQ